MAEADQRHANKNWVVTDTDGKEYASTYRAPRLAVLMDIRDELRRIRNVLECSRFRGLPAVVDQIAANTKRPKRKAKA